MKQPFNKSIIQKIELYAKKKNPEEMCGFIVNDDFIPLKNIAEDKINNFKVDQYEYVKYRDKIQAIVHSHADYSHISKTDMEGQIRSDVPWGVVLLKNGAVEHTVFWGDSIPIYELLERPFIHGVMDCYALVRDYWRLKGFDIPDFQREMNWWVDEPSMLINNCKKAGFYFIDESQLKIGDVVLMEILAPVVNHSAIYIGDGLLLHHLAGRLSRREPLLRWRKHITHYLRYKHAT